MRILVTNDDGIRAGGLVSLVEALSDDAEVLVVAPDRERSATGHGITVHHPLRVEETRVGRAGIQGWAVEGTPADCVKLAIDYLMPDPPDIVVSGINRGPNLGTDVLYSGTVSAALEGIIHDIPSLAVSLTTYSDPDYSHAALVARGLVHTISRGEFPPDVLINVNVPALPPDLIQGYRIARLGTRRWQNVFEKRRDPRGRLYFWLAGDVVDVPGEAGTDVEAIREGLISITPIHFDLTNYSIMKDVGGWLGEKIIPGLGPCR